MTFSPDTDRKFNEDIINVLTKAGFGGSGLHTEPLPAEASARRYFRVHLSGNPDLIICRDYPFPGEDQNEFIEISKYLKKYNIPVPEIYACDPPNGLILMSDGGDFDISLFNNLYSEDKLNDLNNSAAKTELISHMQHTFLRSQLYYEAVHNLTELHSVPPSAKIKERKFDYDKLKWEMDFLKERIRSTFGSDSLNKLWTTELEKSVSSLCSALSDLLEGKTSSGSALKMYGVLTHRDYHSRNLIFFMKDLHKILNNADPAVLSGFEKLPDLQKLKLQKDIFAKILTVIDYQDARQGLPVYDLVSLLFDAYSPLSASEINYFIKIYFSLAAVKGILVLKDYSEDMTPEGIFSKVDGLISYREFYNIFMLQNIQRMLKVTGSFLFLGFEKKMQKYLESLKITLKSLQTLENFLLSCGSVNTSEGLIILPELRETVGRIRIFLENSLSSKTD